MSAFTLMILTCLFVQNHCLFECDDGCQIFDDYVNDDYCDCTNCEDEIDWTCDNCNFHCPTECGDYRDCGGHNLNASFECDDGCTISVNYINDNMCDCSNCEDESDWTCETCNAGVCPSSDECGWFVHCDYKQFGDCTISWGQVVLITLETLIIILCLFVVSYFIYQMHGCKQRHCKQHCIHKKSVAKPSRPAKKIKKLGKKFSILVTICNVLYLMVAMLSLCQTISWILLWCPGTYYIDYQYEIIYFTWRGLQYLAYIATYFNFIQRFIYSLKDSLFELTRIKYFLYFCSGLLISTWIWDVCVMIVYISLYESNNWKREFIVGFYEVYLEPGEELTFTAVMRAYIVCSIIAIFLFIYKFRQLIAMFAKSGTVEIGNCNNNGTNNYQTKRADMFVSMVSRTTILVTIALFTTSVLMIVMQLNQFLIKQRISRYELECMDLLLGVDIIVNIFCLNLQYEYGKHVYYLFKCNKVENKAKTCILWCYFGNSGNSGNSDNCQCKYCRCCKCCKWCKYKEDDKQDDKQISA